jgi:hypothetical protein
MHAHMMMPCMCHAPHACRMPCSVARVTCAAVAACMCASRMCFALLLWLGYIFKAALHRQAHALVVLLVRSLCSGPAVQRTLLACTHIQHAHSAQPTSINRTPSSTAASTLTTSWMSTPRLGAPMPTTTSVRDPMQPRPRIAMRRKTPHVKASADMWQCALARPLRARTASAQLPALNCLTHAGRTALCAATHTHTHTHTHTRARTHTHTHTLQHAFLHAHEHTLVTHTLTLHPLAACRPDCRTGSVHPAPAAHVVD